MSLTHSEHPSSLKKTSFRNGISASLLNTTLTNPWVRSVDNFGYFFIEELDKNDVRQALAEIQAKTCIKFVYNANPRSYHLNYLRVDSATLWVWPFSSQIVPFSCGLSYVGRVSPANPIYLSFQCGNVRKLQFCFNLCAVQRRSSPRNNACSRSGSSASENGQRPAYHCRLEQYQPSILRHLRRFGF